MNDTRDPPPPCQHATCMGHFAATGDARCILERLMRQRRGAGEWITTVVSDPVRALSIAALLGILATGAITAIVRGF